MNYISDLQWVWNSILSSEYILSNLVCLLSSCIIYSKLTWELPFYSLVKLWCFDQTLQIHING